jgi:hypothetical protein
MKWLLVRYGRKSPVFGELYIDGTFECYTYERHPIVRGVYPVYLNYSQKMKICVPYIYRTEGGMNVARFYPGNEEYYLEGDILPGIDKSSESVTNPREACGRLTEILHCALHNGRKVELEIVEIKEKRG